VPAATPVLLNLASIAAALWLGPLFQRWGIHPIYAQAVGVMIGGIAQLAIPVPRAAPHRRAAAHRAAAGQDPRGLGAPGRRARVAADGAGAGRRIGGAGLDPDQHPDRDATRASARSRGSIGPAG